MLAVDQYGAKFYIKKHPRKELCERLGCQHADKMYIDTKDGTKQVGYVIKGHWLTLYKEMEL